MTCKDCVYATQPTTTMRCRNHGIFMGGNAVVCNEFKVKPQTNADRIRAMTDEELADWLNDHNFNCPPVDCPGEDYCVDCWLEWLKQEAE